MHSLFNPLLIQTKTPDSSTLEYNPPVLDLCLKKKKESPSYTLTYPSPRHSPVYLQPPEHYNMIPRGISESPESMDSSKCDPKLPRPFKVFPKNPLAFSYDVLTKIDPLRGCEPPLVQETDFSTENYEEFRKNLLAKVRDYNGTNYNMRRYQNQSQKNADPLYLEKRRKNNEAAKKSRDARKAREDEIAIRCAFLEKENIKLKAQLAAVQADAEKLKKLLFLR